jgi:hypothetical protein
MAEWACGAQRGLPIDDGADWDPEGARSRILEWSATQNGKIDYRLAQQGFLVFDGKNYDLKGSYQLPFADVGGGELRCSPAGLKKAAAALEQFEAPRQVIQKAQAVADEYIAVLRELDRRRQQREQEGVIGDDPAHRLYELGLQCGTFFRQKGEFGPIITFIPLGQIDWYPNKDMDQPTCEEYWKLAELAIDAALSLDKASFKREGQDCFVLGLQAIWPEVEKGLMGVLDYGTDGGLLRAKIEMEGQRRANEALWSSRENARREGLLGARRVLRDLARALTLDSAADRALVLAQHHKDLSDVLQS